MALSAWAAWKTQCAGVLCTEVEQAALYAFAATRFRRYADRCAAATRRRDGGAIAANVRPADAWHLFETHLCVATTREGKRYKDWLFARTAASPDPPLHVIESGAALLMRNVVREYVAHEIPPRDTVPLEGPVARGRDGSPLTLHELLSAGASPADEAARREYEALARERAEGMFAALSHRERVALLARHLGLSLACPAVERAAGCRKSMLNAAYRALARQVGARIRLQFADDGADSVLALALLVMRALGTLADQWGKSEKACANLFMLVEEVQTMEDGT